MTFLKYEQSGPVVTLTMDAPEMRNALSGAEAVQSFVAACARIDSDSSVRAVVLTGAGPAFSAGGDIRAMHRAVTGGLPTPIAIRNGFVGGIQRITRALYFLETPVVAAINGPAIGAGLDVACMCDLRIASRTATFAESFVRLGLVAGDGGAWLLPRLVGREAASRLAFTGETIDAARALALGLVSDVVEPEALMATAVELADRIAENPGAALRMTKRLLRQSDTGTLDDVLQASAAMQALVQHAPAHREAVVALVEKRPPVFRDD